MCVLQTDRIDLQSVHQSCHLSSVVGPAFQQHATNHCSTYVLPPRSLSVEQYLNTPHMHVHTHTEQAEELTLAWFKITTKLKTTAAVTLWASNHPGM